MSDRFVQVAVPRVGETDLGRVNFPGLSDFGVDYCLLAITVRCLSAEFDQRTRGLVAERQFNIANALDMEAWIDGSDRIKGSASGKRTGGGDV